MRSQHTRVCDGCGVTFAIPKPSSSQHFCTSACWYAFNRRPLADRLWAKVNKDGPLIRPDFGQCWEWDGTRLPKGYGHVWDIDKGRPIYTHRAAWKIAAGEDAGDLNVLHVCDNPSCVRNDELGVYVLRGVAFLRRGHLFLGTGTDNQCDMADKGRGSLGTAKITREDAEEIREIYDRGGISQRRLADLYGLTQPSIHRVLSRESWRV